MTLSLSLTFVLFFVKDIYLPRLARGEIIPCFGLTSPTAGSDAANMRDIGIGVWIHSTPIQSSDICATCVEYNTLVVLQQKSSSTIILINELFYLSCSSGRGRHIGSPSDLSKTLHNPCPRCRHCRSGY